jgi:hypothetical protein
MSIQQAGQSVHTLVKAEVIDHQLTLATTRTVTFVEGGSTTLRPVGWVPELAGAATVSLDGEWAVTRWPFPADEAALLGAQQGMASWESVQQPGPVFWYDPEQSPDGIPGWNRVTLEHIDPDDGALLCRTLTVPAAWAGKRILLRFEGIYPAGRIYWDGQPVAEQWSGLTPIEVDVTEMTAPGGQHTVAVRCYRRHPSVQLDMPRHAMEFTGLARTAFLHAVEPVHIGDINLFSLLADDYCTGTISGEVSLRNAAGQDARATLTARLLDADDRLVVEHQCAVVVAAGSSIAQSLSMHAGVVAPWSAECPVLYTLELHVSCPGQAEQRVRQRMGFRRFEIVSERPLLNGNPVKFRGVNHLTCHPESGMYTPKPWLRQNLIMMKRANINAIRTHFTSPRELVDLCDELGIYLLQELPIDWGHTYLFDPVHLGPVLHRLHAGVRRDRHHPSLMVWSVGNENMARTEEEYGVFMEHMHLFHALVKRLDPQRPTMFPPPGPANKIAGIFEARMGEIADIHYSFNLIREFNETGVVTNPRTWEPTFETHTRQQLLDQGWSGVWFSSEYGITNHQADLLHAPYLGIIADIQEDSLSGKNSQQAFYDRLAREWGYMRDDPTCLGGAYFCWIAGGVGDPWGWTRWGEDADWGVLTGDLTPKPAFWVVRELFSPVHFPARVTWHPGQTALTLAVRNDYNCIDLAACTLRTQMGGGPPWIGCMQPWRDIPIAGAPGSVATVEIPLWNAGSLQALENGNPIACRCTLLDPQGFRVLMTDILVFPEDVAQASRQEAMPLGPDAE